VDNASIRETTIVDYKSGKSDKQTSDSAFLGPVKWFPNGAIFGVDQNGEFIRHIGYSVLATLRTEYAQGEASQHKEYSQDGKPFDLAQTSIFVPDNPAIGTFNASDVPEGKFRPGQAQGSLGC